jgi:3-phosphoshikimate 1-carboxyvinyltransferase
MIINFSGINQNSSIELPVSKSIYNRLLIINKLSNDKIKFTNSFENSDDTIVLKNALENITKNTVDIEYSGTAMRFLTAYYSILNGQKILTGSDRMKERPIKILVETLKQLGAKIEYIENFGYPPLKIEGTEIDGGHISISANISSQYISAILMVAPYFKYGLQLEILGKIVSLPYISMTIKLMQQCGAAINWKTEKIIDVKPIAYKTSEIKIESDWSAASYWYQIIALCENGKITLKNLHKNSLQGDSVVEKYYRFFGVETRFHLNDIEISYVPKLKSDYLELNLSDTPDLAQTIACTCVGLKIKCKLTGLSTLQIKETNRIKALQNELLKFGVISEISSDHFEIKKFTTPNDIIDIETYQDHRMAMAFAPLSIKFGKLEIKNHGVVSKSYPMYWKHLESVYN